MTASTAETNLSYEFPPAVLPIDDDLWLQRVSASDWQEYYDLVSANPNIRGKGLYWIDDLSTPVDAQDICIGDCSAMLNGQGLYYWIVQGHKKIGQVDIELQRQSMTESTGEIFGWLIEEAQRQGIMSRAGRQLVVYATQRHGLKSVQAVTLQHNDASNVLAERLGFTLHDSTPEYYVWERVTHGL